MANVELESTNELRQRKYRQAASLIGSWLRDDPAYDERVGTVLEIALQKDPVRCEDEDENPA